MTLKVPGCPSTGGIGTVSTHRVNEPQRCTCRGARAACDGGLMAAMARCWGPGAPAGPPCVMAPHLVAPPAPHEASR